MPLLEPYGERPDQRDGNGARNDEQKRYALELAAGHPALSVLRYSGLE